MNICNEVKDAGVEKFEKLLVGLADQGYVTKEALPLLAYRLSGCGRPFGEEQVVWLGDKRVIRFIIAKFHAIGTHYVGPLNKYFVDAYGQTFLQGISADLARNIKSLAIFKDVISPLYKDIIRLL